MVGSANLNALALSDLAVEHALDGYLSYVDTFHDPGLLFVARAGPVGARVDRDLARGYGLHLLLPDRKLLGLSQHLLALELLLQLLHVFQGLLRFLGVFARFALDIELEFELALVGGGAHACHASP